MESYINLLIKFLIENNGEFKVDYLPDRFLIYNEVTLFRTIYYRDIFVEYKKIKLLN